jgi:TPR repeat protein/serine/threonine protein kinase
MNRLTACPDVSAYRELMRGRSVLDPDALLGHLETCEACRRTVLAIEDWLLHASTGNTPDSPARRRARQIASGEEGSEASTNGAGHSVAVLPAGFLSPPEEPGELGRLGNYRILRILGRGGMGVVFEAIDANLGRRVALKVMRPDLAANASHRQRFLREARASASIESDHVCPIYQVGEANGVPFIAMPLLKGETLEARLRRQRSLSISDAVRIGREIALGLAAAHDRGLVHRDVKPANVWLDSGGTGPARARLLDFGLARGDADKSLTLTGEVMGTPAYLSPEQGRGLHVDGRTDLFALGVILYEMTTGARPFRGGDVATALSSLALDTPDPPAARRQDVPYALSDYILRLLEKDPNDRPASAAEVAARLAEFRTTGTPAAAAPSSATPRSSAVPRSSVPASSAPPSSGVEASGVYELLMNEEAAQAAPTPSPASSLTPRPVPAVPTTMKPGRGLVGRLVWVLLLGLALALGGGLAAYVLGHPTSDGSLVVEVDGDAEALFAAGELHVQAVGGRPKYVLKPGEKKRSLPPGRYRVRIDGADGLRLEPEEFDVPQKGEVAVRVSLATKPTPTMDDAQYLAAMRRAEAAMKGSRYEEAKAAYAEALKLKPNDPDALRGQAEAARLLAEEQAAKDAARQREAQKPFRDGMDALRGLSRPLDDERALSLFRQAAAKGHAAARVWVGRLTFLGQGVRKDEVEGLRLVKEALPDVHKKAGAGDVDAMALLGALYADGMGVTQDERQAFSWFEKAAEKGDPFAMDSLGVAFARGLGVDQDHQAAAFWYEKAAEKGDTFATFHLGEACSVGRGVKKDEPKAVRLFQEAADKGHADAMFHLGLMHAGGRGGLARDVEAALKWFHKAAALGHAGAKRKLEDEKAYQKAMRDARAAFAAKNWSEALDHYAAALKLRVDDPAALAGRKAAQDALDRDRAGALAEKNYQDAMDRAEAAMKAKKYQQARSEYAAALKYRPKDPEALRGRDEADRLLEEQATAAEADKRFRDGLDSCLGLTGKVDEVRALRLFRQAAARNHEVARGWEGRLTYLGRGTLKDEAAGLKLVRKCLPAVRRLAQDGDAEAQGLLGALYASGLGEDKDDKTAAEWYKKAAAQGSVSAMNNLGVAYEHGLGVVKNERTAVSWYEKAADKGCAIAITNLGVMYATNRGVDKNVKKAVELYKKAAGKGYAFAMINLGVAYAKGEGVDKDRREAANWFDAASKDGAADVAFRLGEIYSAGKWADLDLKRAAQLYKKAADLGHDAAMNNLGRMYEYGEGVEENYEKAVEWYKKSADKGSAVAMNNLGVMYELGRGVGKRDIQKAIRWYEKGADKGSELAAFNLGRIYENGVRGVEADKKEALKWYRRAAALGHPDAKKKVEALQ